MYRIYAALVAIVIGAATALGLGGTSHAQLSCTEDFVYYYGVLDADGVNCMTPIDWDSWRIEGDTWATSNVYTLSPVYWLYTRVDGYSKCSFESSYEYDMGTSASGSYTTYVNTGWSGTAGHRICFFYSVNFLVRHEHLICWTDCYYNWGDWTTWTNY